MLRGRKRLARVCCARFTLLKFALLIALSGLSLQAPVLATQAAAGQSVFAYSVNSMDDSVTSYLVNDEGKLVYNGHWPTNKFPSSLALHPSGKYMAVTSQTSNNINVYKVNQKTGRLSGLGDPIKDKGMSLFDLEFGPSGKFLYVTGRISNGISVYAFNEKTGQLMPVTGSPFKTPARPRQLLIHPSGRYLYVVSVYDDIVTIFNIDNKTGVLKEIPNSPVKIAGAPLNIKMTLYEQPEHTKAAPYNLAMDKEGKTLYVPNWISGSISAFVINEATGGLTEVKGSPFITEAHPYNVAVDPSGKFLYSVHWSSNIIVTFKRDVNGALLRVKGSEIGSSGIAPVDMWIEPSGKRLYVANYVTSNISLFKRDALTGRLQFEDAVISRRNLRRISFVLGESKAVTQSDALFTVDFAAEKLLAYELKAGIPQSDSRTERRLSGKPVSLTYDRSNKLVYVATQRPNQIGIFKYRPSSHELQPLKSSPLALEQRPSTIRTGITGDYVYVSNTEHNSLGVFEFDAEKNTLLPWPLSPFATDLGPVGLRMGSGERLIYTVNERENTISAFLYGEGRQPTPLVRNLKQSKKIFKTGATPKDIIFEPGGKFAYVLNYDEDTVSPYWVHHNNGELTQTRFPGHKTGKGPISAVVHPNSKYLYVVNHKGSTVSRHSLNSANGIIGEPKLFKTRKEPIKIRLNANGDLAYVSYKASSYISVFSIDKSDGKLNKIRDVKLHGQIKDFDLHYSLPIAAAPVRPAVH